MLTELTIRNFALIEELSLSLPPGFSVLTGETGAGKSIIIDALSAALGERVNAELVRGGAEAASVDAVFDVANNPRALAALQANGLADGDDTVVVLTRQISAGRSPCRVNGRPVTLGVLQEISRHLVDIHGQHEHQALIHEENHLEFLDQSGSTEHRALRDAYEAAYQAYHDARVALDDLRARARDRAQRLDILRYQVQEIQEADLRAGEEEELLGERRRLQSVERLREWASQARRLLEGDGDNPGAAAAVQEAAATVSRLVEIDGTLTDIGRELVGAANIVTEAESTLRHYEQDLEAEPERLEWIERRLDLFARLRRKYGDTLADVVSYGEAAAAELAELENAEDAEERLAAEVERTRQQAGAAGVRLSASRRQLAERLAQQVCQTVATLGMPAAQFVVQLDATEDPDGLPGADGRRLRAGRRGTDTCRFLLSANAGEEPRPLAKVASGGELSRLMLAFKSLCSRSAEIPTIVFDEIDVGIGGQTAHQIGARLKELAAHAQVLCVTHLPQIAGLADHQLAVEKVVVDGRTVVAARVLAPDERVEELARMLGAAEGDQAAREHAATLLGQTAVPRAKGRRGPASQRTLP
ncbi:MAG: DNA repair protein RecN [Armatimonadetes bacterium]|nr:DNA repair protein RecN [Armatimonadota bacterium]